MDFPFLSFFTALHTSIWCIRFIVFMHITRHFIHWLFLFLCTRLVACIRVLLCVSCTSLDMFFIEFPPFFSPPWNGRYSNIFPRIYKHVSVPVARYNNKNELELVQHRVHYSSMPGYLASVDDFYITKGISCAYNCIHLLYIVHNYRQLYYDKCDTLVIWDGQHCILAKLVDFFFSALFWDYVINPRAVFCAFLWLLITFCFSFPGTSDLSVIETSISLYNKELLKDIQPKSVLCWMRVIVSNALARDGKDWTDTFTLYNSGTYNNGMSLHRL